MTFGTFGHAKVPEKKSYFMILRGRTMFAPTISKPEFYPKSKRKIHALSPCLGDADTHASHMCQFPLFLLHMQAQKKKLSKKKRR